MKGKNDLSKEKKAIIKKSNIDDSQKKNNNNAEETKSDCKDSNLKQNDGGKKETNAKNNSISFTLRNKMNFDDKKIITVKELSNNRIGILFVKLLSIYSTKTFKKINEINLDNIKNSEKNEEDSDNQKEIVINFLELKNSDLVLWTTEANILFYKLSDSNYIFSQAINENTQKEEEKRYFHMERFYSNNKDDYNINSIFQLSNGNLVSCNTNGIKIYCNKNDKYELELNCPMDIEVISAIENKANQLVLFQANFVSGGFCSQSYHCTLTYSASLYDIENKKSFCLNKFEENVSLRNNSINFFSNDELLFVKYGQFKFDIFDKNQNMKSLNKNNEIIGIEEIKEFINFTRLVHFNRIKDDMNISFLCNYSKDLFFAKDIYKNIKLYKFKDKSFEYYQDFPLSNKEIRGMIKLINNNIIMYSLNEIIVAMDAENHHI